MKGWRGTGGVRARATLAGCSAMMMVGAAVGWADSPQGTGLRGPKQAAAAAKARQKQQAQRRRALRAARMQSDDLSGPGLGSNTGPGPGNSGQAGSGSSAVGGSNGIGSAGFGVNGVGTATANLVGTAASGATGASSSGTGQTGGTNREGGNSLTATNAKIVEFAVNNLGQQVGNGECYALAAEALAYAGAQPPRGYVFGTVVPMTDLVPGDILQFENALFVGANYWMRLGAPGHTAIVAGAQGTSVLVYQQNYNGVRRVQKGLINFADMRSGAVTAYRAVPMNAGGD